LGLNWLIF